MSHARRCKAIDGREDEGTYQAAGLRGHRLFDRKPLRSKPMAEREPPDLDHVREELEREREDEGARSSPPTRREEIPPERIRESLERLDPQRPDE